MLYFNNLIVSLHPEKQSNSFNIHQNKKYENKEIVSIHNHDLLIFCWL